MAAPTFSYTVTEFEASPGLALRHARDGETVEITSHGETVAILIGSEGDAILPGGPLPPLPEPIVFLKPHTPIEQILAEDRR